MSDAAIPAAPAPAPVRRRHPLLHPRIAVPVAALLLLVHLPFLHAALRGPREVTVAVPFRDSFDRATIGDNYWSNGGHWRIVRGELYSPGVLNNPLWLKARLPADVRIEFDARSEGPDGDIKVEFFGDGRNHATGYVLLFGAWRNRESRLAKLDEHAPTAEEYRAHLAAQARPYPYELSGVERLVELVRGPWTRWRAREALEDLEAGTFFDEDTPVVVKRSDAKVIRGKTYRVAITRKGGHIRWENDGELVLELRDPAPLSGAGHDRFGFSSWMNDTYFDNLVITPLEGG